MDIRNCEDIAMSFLVANATGAPPIWVKGKCNLLMTRQILCPLIDPPFYNIPKILCSYNDYGYNIWHGQHAVIKT